MWKGATAPKAQALDGSASGEFPHFLSPTERCAKASYSSWLKCARGRASASDGAWVWACWRWHCCLPQLLGGACGHKHRARPNRQSAPPRIGVSGNGIGSAVLFARTKHRGDWSEMRQLKISLTDDLRRQLAKVSAAAGHSLALEIRRRLQRTLEQDGSDPQTSELMAGNP